MGKAPQAPHAVYMLKCGDGTLYTGVARNVTQRVHQHREGKGARYTRSRRPLELIFVEWHACLGDALRRERAIKRLAREAKLELVRTPRPGQADPVPHADREP